MNSQDVLARVVAPSAVLLTLWLFAKCRMGFLRNAGLAKAGSSVYGARTPEDGAQSCISKGMEAARESAAG